MAPDMKPNPQIVKDEILDYLRKEGLAVYHVEPDMWPNEKSVWWDTDKVSDYRKFIVAAKSSGAKMILYYDAELSEGMLAEAEDALELASLEPEEFREYARSIGDLRSYLGFTSRLGIGFALEGLFYWFELEAPWFEELVDILEELQLASLPYGEGMASDSDDDDDPGKPPMGNFYSNN